MLRERAHFADVVLAIELGDDLSYRLAYGERVEYTPGKRRVGGRTTLYVFRSVEQLRYDFERDVQSVGGELG